MNVLKEAWIALTPKTLRNSWNKIIPKSRPESVELSENINSSNNELIGLINRIPGGVICSSSEVDNWLEEEQNLPTFEIISDEQLLNIHAEVNLPIERELDENDFESAEKFDENDEKFDEPKTFNMHDVFKAAQLVYKWTRNNNEFTNEEQLTFTKARNLAFDSFSQIFT